MCRILNLRSSSSKSPVYLRVLLLYSNVKSTALLAKTWRLDGLLSCDMMYNELSLHPTMAKLVPLCRLETLRKTVPQQVITMKNREDGCRTEERLSILPSTWYSIKIWSVSIYSGIQFLHLRSAVSDTLDDIFPAFMMSATLLEHLSMTLLTISISSSLPILLKRWQRHWLLRNLNLDAAVNCSLAQHLKSRELCNKRNVCYRTTGWLLVLFYKLFQIVMFNYSKL